MKKCIWCKGTGSIALKVFGTVTCLNCKGTGEGKDGGGDGPMVTGRTKKKFAAERQPLPTPGGIDVLPLVVDDLRQRSVAGTLKYGVTLQTNNGRDALLDAYQEALDLCMYLRQAIEERK